MCSDLIFWPWLKVLMLVAVFLLDLGKNMFSVKISMFHTKGSGKYYEYINL